MGVGIRDVRTSEFSDEYIERCFAVWYSLNQPTNLDILWNGIPDTPEGIKPSKTTLKQFRDNHGWVERADALTTLAVQKNDELLVTNKADMLREMAKDAAEIRAKAKSQIMQDGFDTSASAVNAYFKASEEERTVRGVSEMVIKISRMSTEELEARKQKLLQRRNSVDSVDGELVEDINADSGSERT